MKKYLLNFLIIGVFAVGCKPQNSANEQSNANSLEIKQLEKRVNELNKELEEKNAKKPLTEDPNYNQLKQNIDELRSDLLRHIGELEKKLQTRLGVLESKLAGFTTKLDYIENNYVSISDFEALKIQIEDDYLKKQELIELQIQNSSNPEALKLFQSELSNIKQRQAELENEYKDYYKKAMNAWSKKLIDMVNEGFSSQSKQLKDFVAEELARVNLNLEAQVALIKENEEIRQNIDELYQNRLKELEGKFENIYEDIDSLKDASGKSKQYFSLLASNQKVIDDKIKRLAQKHQRLEEIISQVQREVRSLDRQDDQFEKRLVENAQILEKLETPDGKQIVTSTQISQLNDLIKNAYQRIESLSQRMNEINHLSRDNVEGGDKLVRSIIDHEFMPCRKGLKDMPYCYTFGTMIKKLGGTFVDPMGYKRSENDFIKFLIASGIKSKAILTSTSTYLKPSAVNKPKFRSCHGDDPYQLLAPRKYWPRMIILGLVMDKVETQIKTLRQIDTKNGSGLIESNVRPSPFINSWWRTTCYQRALGSETGISDHTSGAAIDPQMENKSSLEFYRDYIQENLFEYDRFGLTHPLSISNLTFRTSLAFANDHAISQGDKRFHFGIASEVKKGSSLRGCSRWQYTRDKNGNAGWRAIQTSCPL